jgi:hypothetical protein
MTGLSRSLRDRFCEVFLGAAMLLCITGLAAAILADVSFGHEHLVDGHVFYHHHFHFGPHEHPGTEPGHRRQPKAPVPHPHGTPRKTATVSLAPPLIQPAVASLLLSEPLIDSTSYVPVRALPPVVRPVAQVGLPRGPPAPGFSRFGEKRNPRCRP